MPTNQEITDHKKLLQAHRRALQVYLEQLATNSSFPPPDVVIGRDEARRNIAQIKYHLRSWGIECENYYNDDTEDQFFYQQMIDNYGDIPSVILPSSPKIKDPNINDVLISPTATDKDEKS